LAEVLFHYLMRFLPAAFVGSWVILSTARRIAIGAASRSWPTVRGRVVRVERAPAWAPVMWIRDSRWKGTTITYTYGVDGVNYQSSVVGVHGSIDQPDEHRRSTRVQYRKGEEVLVHHNPRRHHISILEPGIGRRDVIVLMLTVAAMSWWLHWAMSGDAP
jgi:hypothetical protein